MGWMMNEVRIPQHKIWDYIHTIGYQHFDLKPDVCDWIFKNNIMLKWDIDIDNTITPFVITGVNFYFNNTKDAILFKLVRA
jgi:hypothetical protein